MLSRVVAGHIMPLLRRARVGRRKLRWISYIYATNMHILLLPTIQILLSCLSAGRASWRLRGPSGRKCVYSVCMHARLSFFRIPYQISHILFTASERETETYNSSPSTVSSQRGRSMDVMLNLSFFIFSNAFSFLTQ